VLPLRHVRQPPGDRIEGELVAVLRIGDRFGTLDDVQPVSLGLLLGVPAALGTSRAIGALLYEVSPAAPHIFIMATAVLAASALGGALVPVHRAGPLRHIDRLQAGLTGPLTIALLQ
jgi:hypothetical protein